MPKLQIQRGRSSQPAGPTSPKGKNSVLIMNFKKTKSPPKPNLKSRVMKNSEEDEELYEESESFLEESTEGNSESDPDDEYVDDEESEEEESNSEDDDDDEDEIPSKKGKRPRKGTSRAALKNQSKKRIPSSRTSDRRNQNKFSDTEEEAPTRRSSRNTAKRAKALITAAVADDNNSFFHDSEDESSSGLKKQTQSIKKKSPFKTNGMDDDDFISKKTRSSSANSKTQSKGIGYADSISFDDSSESEVSPKKLLSPKLTLKKGRLSTTSTKISTPFSPVLPHCTSTHDCITMEALPRLHVCYRTPDNRTCHCFALETLYKAAMMPGLRRYKADGQLAFLQPPHFRTIIDGNLEDQIASRFGRKALIIEESSVYLSKQDPYQRHAHHPEDDSDNDGRLLSFEDRLSKYLSDQMGSGDLYCCPICYSEAHQRFLGHSSNDDKNCGDEYETLLSTVTASKVDPMSILGSLDDDEFHVASYFCFRKLVNLKNHIKQIHYITLKGIDVNSLLKKFKIRDQDGLLQRHLLEYYHGRVRSTSMRTYWTEEGNDRAFILLRSLIELKEECGDDEEEGSCEFCSSFPHRAKQMWDSLSGPFEKDIEDIEDFITDEQEEEDAQPFNVFEQPKNLEDEIIEALRSKKNKKKLSKSSSSEEDQQSPTGDEDDVFDNVASDDNIDDEVLESSGEDSWYQKKRDDSKEKRKLKTPPLRKLKTKKQEDLDDDDDDDDDDSSLLLVEAPVAISSAESRKRRIIDDD